MNRKKLNKIYNFSEPLEEIKTKKKINDNYMKKTQKNSDKTKYISKKLKTEEIDNKTKSKYEDSVPTMQTLNSPKTSQLKNIKENSQINNEINKTPKKIKNSKTNNKNESEDDLVTSFERKPSELKSPETISEDSFTSSYEKEEKENNEIIFVDKIKEGINSDKLNNINKKEKQNTQKIINLDNYNKNNEKSNLKIKVNKSPRESINKNKPVIESKKEINNKNKDIKPDINLDEKKNKNDKLLLTNIKTVKQKKFLIQTEDKKRRYIRKYINFGKNNNFEMNKSQTNINKENKKEDNDDNNKMKTGNKLEQENKNIINQKKKEIIINKTINNKLGIKVEEINTNTKEININKNQNYTTLSRNISFHNNSQKLIYAPKKLVSATILKSPKKQEIQSYKKIALESFIPLSENIKNVSTSMKNSNKKINLDIKSNPEQIRKKIFELNKIFKKN